MMRHVVRVLMVDDDPGDVELTRAALDACKLDLDIDVTEDGESALAYLRGEAPFTDRRRPDVILLDLNMPRMDGRELLQHIREDPALRDIPVIILTTSNADSDVAAAYANGANCYVSKPLGLAEFTQVVNAVGNFWFTIVKLPPRDE